MHIGLRQAWIAPLTGIALLSSGPATGSEPWSATLERGGRVEVDPRTNRPLLIQDGRETQLWDGVHRLEDGSVIRIQGGRVIPTTEMRAPAHPDRSEADDSPPAGEHISGASPCETLVIKTCGASRACWTQPPCEAARQLRDMEQED